MTRDSYVTPHDIKNYDQLSEIVWDKTWSTLTEIERKIAIDVAKHILDQHIVWTDNIRYFVSEKMEAIEKRKHELESIHRSSPYLF